MRLINALFAILVMAIMMACTQSNKEVSNEPVSDDELLATATFLHEKGFGYSRLSEYEFFKDPLDQLVPATTRIVPYDLNTPLFTDYADKERFVYIPDEGVIQYKESEVLDFPDGSVLIKNFLYSRSIEEGKEQKRIIETRLLVFEKGEWAPRSYVWNKDQTEAYLTVSGATEEVEFVNGNNERISLAYKVPTVNQCKSCHMLNGKITPIGPTARQLHRVKTEESFIHQWAKKGLLNDVPQEIPLLAQWDNSATPIDDRARAYLDINCGACHRSGAPAKTSGLDLTVFSDGGYALGVGKKPVAAGKGSGGLLYDIVPGRPDESILLYRMESTDPSVMMPELGRSSVHKEGVALIKEWIKTMESNKRAITAQLLQQ